MRGKKVILYLEEGHARGIIKGRLESISLEIIRSPRSKLKELKEDINESGVYFLSVPQDQNVLYLYIGQSENVFTRLKTHEQDENKDIFEDIFIIKTSDKSNPLNGGYIRYLENKLIQIAKNSSGIDLDNKTSPENTTPLSKADKDVMDEYIDNILIILSAMGLNLYTPKAKSADKKKPEEITNIESPRFIIRPTNANINATLQVISGEFVVLQGSEALSNNRDSMPESYGKLKEYLVKHEFLKQHEDKLIFSQDVAFKSPSAAAAIILGTSINGRHYWLLEQDKNKTYGTWQWEQINK